MSLPLTKRALLADISQSRAAVIRDFRVFRSGMNIAEKLRNSVRSHPPFWLGGAAVVGFLFTQLFGKRGKYLSSLVGGEEKEEASPSSPFSSSSLLSKSIKLLANRGGMLLNISRLLFPVVKSAVTTYAANKICKLRK